MAGEARASYIIQAVDQTKETVRQIRANFQSLDRGVKGTATSINAAMGILAGVGLRNLFRNTLEATKEAAGETSGFAYALDQVRAAARNLMASKEGLPGATQALNQLTETLKDPETVKAFDAIASSIIKIGAGVGNLAANYATLLAKGWKGWQIMLTGEGGNEQVDLDSKILGLQQRADFFRYDQSDSGRKRFREIQHELAEARSRYRQMADGQNPIAAVNTADAFGSMSEFGERFAARSAAAAQAAKDMQKAMEDLQKTSAKLAEQGSLITPEDNDDYESQEKAREYYNKVFDDYQKRLKESQAATADWRDNLSEFALQAARNMQDALADFFFDPFHDGLRGMLKGFVDVIRRMVAELAASKILDVVGKSGFFGKASSFLGSLFGGFKAEGGPVSSGRSYVVGERGPELFTPGTSGHITPNGGGRNVTVAPVFNIDARGAQVGVAEQIQRALRAAAPMIVDAARVAVRDDMSRGAWA